MNLQILKTTDRKTRKSCLFTVLLFPDATTPRERALLAGVVWSFKELQAWRFGA